MFYIESSIDGRVVLKKSYKSADIELSFDDSVSRFPDKSPMSVDMQSIDDKMPSMFSVKVETLSSSCSTLLDRLLAFELNSTMLLVNEDICSAISTRLIYWPS